MSTAGLDIAVAALVLASAFMHASWNVLVKGAGDRLLTMTGVVLVPMLVCGALLPFLPAPAPPSWPFIAVSVATHFAYYTLLLASYGVGDLSHVYPVARGSAPLLVALTAAAFADERLSPLAFLGVAMVSLGIASLAAFGRVPGRPHGLATLYALATGLTVTAYLVADGMGVRRSEAPLGYIAWMFTLAGAPLVAAAVVLRWGRLRREARRHWRRSLGGGILLCLSYGIAVWAMGKGALAHVTALRETGVLFAAVLGTLVLREPFGARRVAAAAAVTAGLVVMNAAR